MATLKAIGSAREACHFDRDAARGGHRDAWQNGHTNGNRPTPRAEERRSAGGTPRHHAAEERSAARSGSRAGSQSRRQGTERGDGDRENRYSPHPTGRRGRRGSRTRPATAEPGRGEGGREGSRSGATPGNTSPPASADRRTGPGTREPATRTRSSSPGARRRPTKKADQPKERRESSHSRTTHSRASPYGRAQQLGGYAGGPQQEERATRQKAALTPHPTQQRAATRGAAARKATHPTEQGRAPQLAAQRGAPRRRRPPPPRLRAAEYQGGAAAGESASAARSVGGAARRAESPL